MWRRRFWGCLEPKGVCVVDPARATEPRSFLVPKRIPLGWRVVPLSQVLEERRMKVSDDEFAPLSVTMDGIVPQRDHVAKTSDGSNRKGVRRGDLVINSRSDRKGASGVSPQDGSVSLISIVMRPVGVESRFLHHLVRSFAFQEEFYRRGQGIVADLWTTRFPALKRIEVALPPRNDQARIADFLDRETAHIDALIEKKERLIALLEEKRAALITRAVTKGLDPNVPMKDSGVEWIGEIPEHWEVVSLGRLITNIQQGWSPIAEDRLAAEGEWAVIKLSAVKPREFVETEHKTLPATLNGDSRIEIKQGDLLITRANTPELVGTACVVSSVRERVMMSDLVYRVNTLDQVVCRRYLVHWLTSMAGRSHVEIEARGASRSMVKISTALIRRWPCILPPMREQNEIAAHLEKNAAHSGALQSELSRSITLLRERRSALITAAVTGQIDIDEYEASQDALQSQE